MTPEQKAILKFIDAINDHDLDALTALLTGNHCFIDSLGREMRGGPDAMRLAWEGYFDLVPDYHVEIDRIIQDGSILVLLGHASGTCIENEALRPENAWRMPAAWRAEMRAGRVAGWQVFADNTPVAEILRRLG